MGSGVPTSFKNPGATAPTSSYGGALGCLGEVLEHLGGVLERPDGFVGCLKGVLGHLGPSWKRPGGVLGASGVRLRVSWGPLCPSCGRLVNVLERLGGILCLTCMPTGD